MCMWERVSHFPSLVGLVVTVVNTNMYTHVYTQSGHLHLEHHSTILMMSLRLTQLQNLRTRSSKLYTAVFLGF